MTKRRSKGDATPNELKAIIANLLAMYWAPGDGHEPPAFILKAYAAAGKEPPPWGTVTKKINRFESDKEVRLRTPVR